METKRNATNMVYEHVYGGIISGQYKAGCPLSENEIAKELQVSRSPVREALTKLEVEGFLSHYANRGTFVSSLTTQDVSEILDMRKLLETHALLTSCQYISDSLLDEIEEELVALSGCVKAAENEERFFAVDRKIHNAIIDYSGNKRLCSFYRLNESQIRRIQHISAKNPSHFSNSTAQHLQIVHMIRARDTEKAVFYLKEHLDTVYKNTMETVTYFNN